MKLLLSAYACEPGKGSEPGVGWNWARALARRGHVVHVITRSNNRALIESAPDVELSLLRFSYYDLPLWARAWKHWPGALYVYYLFWQIGAYRLAKELHAHEKFDCVHHITFVAYRQPSFMGGLGIPFLFGPVGGGESMPAAFRKGIPLSGRIKEGVRGLANALVAWDPLMSHTFSRASLIACTTEETLARIPIRFRAKCIVQPAIGISDAEIAVAPAAPIPQPQFLFIGRLLYWKGVHLVLRAFPQVKRSVPGATLKIVGKGSERAWLAAIAQLAGISASVEWIPSLQREQVAQAYLESLAFVFPSLHDSGGMVVLEALAAGLPVVCLDLGGPGAIVTSSCGVVIESRQRSEEAVIASLAQAMISLATNPAQRDRLSEDAVDRARQMTWDHAAESLYSVFEATFRMDRL